MYVKITILCYIYSMKMNRLILFAFALSVFSCSKKNDTVVSTSSTDSLALEDSVKIQAPENPNAFSIEPISEQIGIGKTLFTSEGETIISFDTQANTGKIKIDGKEISLNHLDFSENNYEISGDGIHISAENGNFQDAINDCNYGTFPEVKVVYNNHTVLLKNIQVQDCPNYN